MIRARRNGSRDRTGRSMSRGHNSKAAFNKGGNIMKWIKKVFIVTLFILISAVTASAQMGRGMMSGPANEDLAKMMQEPNKALTQASIQYMIAFTDALRLQAKERRGQIDAEFIKSAFAEMKRAYGLIEQYQNAHVKTMDAKMQTNVKPMMERMNRNLAAVKMNLDILEKEVNGDRNLDRISLLTTEILKSLDDMPKRPGGMRGQP
jgi:hypothetical protein